MAFYHETEGHTVGMCTSREQYPKGFNQYQPDVCVKLFQVAKCAANTGASEMT